MNIGSIGLDIKMNFTALKFVQWKEHEFALKLRGGIAGSGLHFIDFFVFLPCKVMIHDGMASGLVGQTGQPTKIKVIDFKNLEQQLGNCKVSVLFFELIPMPNGRAGVINTYGDFHFDINTVFNVCGEYGPGEDLVDSDGGDGGDSNGSNNGTGKTMWDQHR